MKRFATLLLLFCTLSSSFAQIIVSGHVRDSIGNPVQAFVTLSPKGTGAMEEYADADEKGYYRIEYNGNVDSLIITASSMGFGNKSHIIANRTQTLDFKISEKTFALKEVLVKADKIREQGDTLNYNVAAYRNQNDRVIADVLKKMPGIEVEDNGKIKFNGKEIKNFYVENMDLLQSRYGIATNNISAEDVATVQVMQHHQPIRAMKDLRPTDDVAINIKLRKEAKGSVILTAMLGAGYAGNGIGDRMQLQGELGEMYFVKRQQNMTLYKGNNTGIDVSQEFRQHGEGTGLLYGSVPLSVKRPVSPGVAQKRYLQNRSHVASTNHIVKIDSTRDVTFNAVYHEDRVRQWGESVSDYYISQGQRMRISETTASANNIHHLEASAKYQINQEKTYLVDRMNLNANWNSTEGIGTMTDGQSPMLTINQHLKCPMLTIDNDLSLLRNLGKSDYNVRFRLGYNQQPHRLAVSPTGYLDGSLADSLSQRYTSRNIVADANTGFGWKFGNFRLSYLLYGNLNMENVESELEGLELPNPQNGYWFNEYNVGIEQYAHLDLSKWFFSITLPISLEAEHLKDRMMHTNESWLTPFVRPQAEIKYIISQSTWFTLNSGYMQIINNGARAGHGLVMHNYRTFQRNMVEEASRDRMFNNSLSFYHKNAYRQFFVNASAAWNHNHSNNVTGIEYDGTQIVCRLTPMPHDYDNLSLNAETSKGIDFWRTTFKLVGGYGLTNTKQLIQSVPTDVRTRYWSTSAYVVTTPLSWLSIACAYAYGQSRNYVSNAANSQKLNNSSTRIDINFFPIQNLVLDVAVEDNYNNLTATNRHAWFGDIIAKYKLKHVDLELQANNIFNQRQYTRVSYSGLDIYTQTSQLRPRNIVASVRFKLL